MTCNSCRNDKAHRIHMVAGGSMVCDRCAKLGPVSVPDVYFKKPYLDPNLAHPDRPAERDGVWVESRSHKVRLMKEQGLREAGDKHHGARIYDRTVERMWNEQRGHR